MSFKHPEFLYALFALLILLIPVIIHLFNFRRYKKQWFSNIQFLKNISTQTRKQNKLKHLMVLLARMLAYAFIVIAFAGPRFGNIQKQAATAGTLTTIYIDNSFSMTGEGETGRLLDEALEQARTVVRQSPRDTRYVLLTNDVGNSRRIQSKEEILGALDEVTSSPARKNLSAVINSSLKIKTDKGYAGGDVWLFSDFQKNSVDTNGLPSDTLSFYYFVVLSQTRERNIYVDSCWIDEPVILPGRTLHLNIRLKNSSPVDLEKIPLKVTVDGLQKAVAGADMKAGSRKLITATFSVSTAGWHKGIIEIEDYPVTFDDKLYFSFRVNQKIRILEIHNGKSNTALQTFYSIDSVFSFNETSFRKVDYNRMSEYNLIILDGISAFSSGLTSQIKAYLEQGGNVMFIPAADTSFEKSNLFLKALGTARIASVANDTTRVVRIKQESDFFRDIILKVPENADLPVVNKHFRYRYNIRKGLESLVTLLDGDDFLLSGKTGKGKLFLLAVPLDERFSNFTTNALFVPVMYRATVQENTRNKLFYTIGKDDQVNSDVSALTDTETPFALHPSDGGPDYIPEQRLSDGSLLMTIDPAMVKAGFYDLVQNDSVWSILAFNYNRNESQMIFFTKDQLDKALRETGLKNYQVVGAMENSFSKVVNTVQKENELWKLFIIFALLMLLTETLILRFWK
ncbi:MAG: hypothetical protein GXO86_03030 [Chlorobi bacterium]|nr:hypothetical protein [Chlorobiota bacterium]